MAKFGVATLAATAEMILLSVGFRPGWVGSWEEATGVVEGWVRVG